VEANSLRGGQEKIDEEGLRRVGKGGNEGADSPEYILEENRAKNESSHDEAFLFSSLTVWQKKSQRIRKSYFLFKDSRLKEARRAPWLREKREERRRGKRRGVLFDRHFCMRKRRGKE